MSDDGKVPAPASSVRVRLGPELRGSPSPSDAGASVEQPTPTPTPRTIGAGGPDAIEVPSAYLLEAVRHDGTASAPSRWIARTSPEREVHVRAHAVAHDEPSATTPAIECRIESGSESDDSVVRSRSIESLDAPELEIGTWEWSVSDDRVHLSPRAVRLHGLDGGSRVPLSALLACYVPGDGLRLRDDLQRSLERGRPLDLALRRTDGARTTVRWSGTAVTQDGVPAGVRGALQPFPARPADDRRADGPSSMVYAVCHDLRAPLRHIRGFVDILVEDEEPRLSPEGRQQLDVIRNSADRMAGLLEQLLEFSRIGREEPRIELTSLNTILRDSLRELGLGTATDGVSWTLDPLPVARCDPRLMRRVFGNLIDNAVKFARSNGEPAVHVGWELHGSDRVAIFVQDNGPGFDSEKADRIFEPFERLRSDYAVAGTGIGLATVRRIVRLHGGEVWARSSPGSGARFSLTLPKTVSVGRSTSK